MEWYTNGLIPSVFLDNVTSHPSVEILNNVNDDFKIIFPPTNITKNPSIDGPGSNIKTEDTLQETSPRPFTYETSDSESIVVSLS